MEYNRRETLFVSVSECLGQLEGFKKRDNIQLKKVKGVIGDVRKASTGNVASMRRKTQNLAALDMSANQYALHNKLDDLKEELERNKAQIEEIDETIEEKKKEYEELKAQIDEMEKELLEHKKALYELRARATGIIRKKELEIEFLQSITGVYFLDDPKCDVAVVVGYNPDTDEPDITFVECGDDLEPNSVERTEKLWKTIEAMSKRITNRT